MRCSPRTWGPEIEDARRLWSRHVVDLVARRVGGDTGEVADALLSMGSQRRYLLLGTLARTRRCTVFAAVDQLLAREVALKVHQDTDDEVVWGVIAEVQAMAGLDHPNIVRVHDLGVLDGWPYLVMELCDEDLEVWSRRGRWPLVIDRLLEAGHGLAAVHAAGLVHGDVKPENILLKEGVAKLGDFGLVAEPGWSARVGGTLGYIAPEVADGERSPAGDVFAFACTAWACMVGHPPFGGAPQGADTSAAALVLVECVRDGVFAKFDVDVPADVLDVLRPALHPDPQDRPSLDQLLTELSAVRHTGQLGRWWRRTWRRR